LTRPQKHGGLLGFDKIAEAGWTPGAGCRVWSHDLRRTRALEIVLSADDSDTETAES
jgi:hypothetical protein